MKKIALATVLALLWTGFASAAAFRELEWGDPPGALGKTARKGLFTALEDFKELSTYYKTNESLELANVQVDQILYGFWQDKLLCIQITKSCPIQDDSLLELMEAKYGRFTSEIPRGLQVSRRIASDGMTGCIVIEYYTKSYWKNVVVVLYSVELAKEYEAARQAKLKAAANSF